VLLQPQRQQPLVRLEQFVWLGQLVLEQRLQHLMLLFVPMMLQLDWVCWLCCKVLLQQCHLGCTK